jgi:ribosome production factor 1
VVDVAALKRRRLEAAEAAAAAEADGVVEDAAEKDDDVDSMLGSDEEEEGDEDEEERKDKIQRQRAQRQPSIAPSTVSTHLDITPDSMAAHLKKLYIYEPPAMPKILVTTGLNGTIHKEAQEIAAALPNGEYFSGSQTKSAPMLTWLPATYIPRSAHRYGHKYSVREIAKFATSKCNSLPLGSG